MIGKIASFLKRILPAFLYNWLACFYQFLKSILRPFNSFYFKIQLIIVQRNHKIALEKVRRKEKIKVAFFLIHDSVWKYEGVYRLMEQDVRFDPVVIVCPYIIYGSENILKDMNQAYNSFKNKGYKVIKTYDENSGAWLDVKNEIRPDIVFFTNPWELTKKEYLITNYSDTLTCYVPYFFHVTRHLLENYGGLLQSLAWKVFYETETHLKYAKIYSKNGASNVTITGYPGLDQFFEKSTINSDPWKIKSKEIKRIIWAPHHTIEGQDAGLKYSNFLKYSQFIPDLAKKYSNNIQIAFKPHPLLKPKLYKDQNWGKEKTEQYYMMWETLENGLLSEGDYVNLFLTSDAMIHDSGSFTVEYLTTFKPSLYTLNDINQIQRLNEFGQTAIEMHYQALNGQDIENFIKDVVINNNDKMKVDRAIFVEKNLTPPNQKTASQNIMDEILSKINR